MIDADPVVAPGVTADALALPSQARAFAITDDDSYTRVAEFLKGIKALRAEIASTFDPHIKRAHEAHASLCAEKRHAEQAAVEAEQIVKGLMVEWKAAQETQRLLDTKRLTEQAVDQILGHAVAAEAAGDVEAVEDALASTPTVAVATATPKVEGVKFTERWSARVTNFAALVAHVATHPHLLGLLLPNTTALNLQARSLKRQLQIPGVEAVCTKDVAAGAR